MKRAIKNHLVDFVAIIVLVVLAAAVSGYILNQERLTWPWSSQYTLNAAFQTGQAVTPGQGQTVRVSGVQIGNIGSVSLKNGVAVVQMDLDPKYSNLIHTERDRAAAPEDRA